jgi:predicted nucleotidyltransferase
VISPDPDFHAILRILADQKVEFIVVGGVCAVLHGAPINTFDLDLVHARNRDNLDRLLVALQSLDAYYRGQGDQKIRPGVSHLASPGHQLLLTRAGPLDMLGTIGTGLGYEELLAHTVEMPVAIDLQVRVLKLDRLIDIKEQTGRDKDKAVLGILRRTLEEQTKP